MKPFMMLIMATVLAVGAVASGDADATRLGGGRSFGRQSQSMPHRQEAPSIQPSPPSRAQPATPATPTTPQSPPNRWLGPIAGIAAGLGIAALLSHLGLSGALAGMLANLLIIAALALIAVWVFRFLSGRRIGGATQLMQQPGSALYPPGPRTAWPQRVQDPYTVPPAEPLLTTGAAASAVTSTQPSAVPADFDDESFALKAKVIFVRMQASWDRGDLDDIREFTTPEMFAEIKVDFDQRGSTPNRTEVVQLNAQVLSVVSGGEVSLASVRFDGLIREKEGEAAEPFSEIWRLSRRMQHGEGWMLAGIQQAN